MVVCPDQGLARNQKFYPTGSLMVVSDLSRTKSIVPRESILSRYTLSDGSLDFEPLIPALGYLCSDYRPLLM